MEPTIVAQRHGIRRLLEENPGFRPALAEIVAEAYDDAVALVSAVARRPQAEFPPVCPFSIEGLLNDEFSPS